MLRQCYRFFVSKYRGKYFIMSTLTFGMCFTFCTLILGSIASVFSGNDIDDAQNLFFKDLNSISRHNRNLQNSLPHDDVARLQMPLKLSGIYKTDDSSEQVRRKSSDHIYMDDEDSYRKHHTTEKLKGSGHSKNKTKNIPQAIIIGVKKAGTRALLEYLRMHPNIKAPGPEPHFFDKNYDKGLKWYRNLMPEVTKGQTTIEKTPSYFVTKGIPERVYKMSKKTKLIIVLRDPVTRAISDYTQLASRNPDVRPFEEMVFVNNRTKIIDTSWAIIRIGVYVQHLARWLDYFPMKQIHFVSAENLIKDPSTEMEKLQKFLGLKQMITADNFTFNETKGFPCFRKDVSSESWHCLNNDKGRTHPTIDPVISERLHDFYRPFTIKLYRMTGINFGWS